MLDRLKEVFPNGWDVPFEEMFLRLGVAFAFGCGVAGICWLAHRRDRSLSPNLVTTLVLLAILIAMLTQVIGDNLARAFSLAGVLAIVRFRTVVEDSRDTAFVIFAVIEGMAVGGGYLRLALVGLAVCGLATLLIQPQIFRPSGSSDTWALAVRIGLGTSAANLEQTFPAHLATWDLTSTSTSRQGAALDLTYSVRLLPTTTSPSDLVAQLNQLEGVQSVELKRV